MFVRTSVVKILIVWNWRTGDVVRVIDLHLIPTLTTPLLQVLKRSCVEDSFLSYPYSEFTFLDEFRLLTSTGLHTMDVHELDLIVFDTSIPQQSQYSWRRFNIAPMHNDRYARSPWAWGAWIYTDGDRSRGEGSRGEPLVVDPTQSVVVLVLYHHECGYITGGEVILVIRAATLVGYMSSTRNELFIPWDDWKRDAMVVEVPHYGISYVRTFVLGSHVLLVTYNWRDNGGRYRVQAYDFSRWGCRTLVRVGDGEKERMVMPNPEKIWFPRENSNGLENMRALGDCLVSCAVSDSQELQRRKGLMSDARRTRSSPVTYASGSLPRHASMSV